MHFELQVLAGKPAQVFCQLKFVLRDETRA
jgi:hypothetical protein